MTIKKLLLLIMILALFADVTISLSRLVQAGPSSLSPVPAKGARSAGAEQALPVELPPGGTETASQTIAVLTP